MHTDWINNMNGFYVFVAVTSLISVFITYCLGRIFKNRSKVKYIPSIISALAGIGFFIKSRFFSTGFEDLAYIILALIAFIVFFVSLVTALIMQLVNRNKSRDYYK